MTPIIIGLSRERIQLTSAEGGVNFDLNADGRLERTSWTARGSDVAFLVLDRNANGRIDDGTELFGNASPQPQSPDPNGFLALAEYDKPNNGGNEDGVINEHDTVFPQLRLWTDANHDGVSESSELLTLGSFGITSISLDYRASWRTDEFGNIFRYRAKIVTEDNNRVQKWAYDVILNQHAIRP